MEHVDNDRDQQASRKNGGLLYPVMLIAAIAVIIFSVVGIATMTGYLPKALSRGEPPPDSLSGSSEPGRTDAPAPAAPMKRASRPATRAPGPAMAQACDNCGVVESIRAVETAGQGSGLGAIGGAVVGGILGNQVGRGSGRTLQPSSGPAQAPMRATRSRSTQTSV